MVCSIDLKYYEILQFNFEARRRDFGILDTIPNLIIILIYNNNQNNEDSIYSNCSMDI